jgi:hypothetical protein
MATRTTIDRSHLLRLSQALEASPRLLRLDDCSWWIIRGRNGWIGVWSDRPVAFLLYVFGRSSRHWSAIKRKLDFCTPSQDGDDEGVLRLEKLPTSKEAKVIREVVGVRKRPTFSLETLEQKRASIGKASAARGSLKAPPLASDIETDTNADPETRDAALVDVGDDVE